MRKFLKKQGSQQAADRLVEAALLAGGQDNITVIVIRITKEILNHEFSMELDELLEKFQAPVGVC